MDGFGRIESAHMKIGKENGLGKTVRSHNPL